jgi:transcriptional regulator with XRE-family HTH domain
MENVSSQVGNRIRLYRQQRGMTQEALALNSGLNVSFLGDIERGNKKPSIESLEKLLGALGVDFREFFDFEVEIKPFRDCTVLEKLWLKLDGRSDGEIELVYNIINQILDFNDSK